MKKFLSLFLCTLFVSGILTGVVTATEPETSTTLDDSIEVHALDDYIEVHTLSECHEMLSEADLQNVDSDAAPYALIHCQAGSEIGRYIEERISHKQTGSETKACSHGVVGGIDIRYEYTDRFKGYCTLCEYTIKFSDVWWGDWICQG